MTLFDPGFDQQTIDEAFDWPLFGLKDDVRPALAEAVRRGVDVVLATLYGVVGGAPRGAGAQMAFLNDEVSGFLSGGCIEADLALHAKAVLATGRSKRIVYGDGGPIDVRLPCGSKIEVLLERVEADDEALARLLMLTGERRLALWLTNGQDRRCVAIEDEAALGPGLAAANGLARRSKEVCGFMQEPFALFRVSPPPLRFVVVGGDPVALAVVKLGLEMGLECHLVRPYGPKTCPISRVRYSRADVRSALADIKPDPWTAICVLSHDQEQEQVALAAALSTKSRYVGALGSRRRVPERNARLRASGVAEVDVERVHAPIGLPIGGKSPWEIAVSIVAEIVSTMGSTSPRV